MPSSHRPTGLHRHLLLAINLLVTTVHALYLVIIFFMGTACPNFYAMQGIMLKPTIKQLFLDITLTTLTGMALPSLTKTEKLSRLKKNQKNLGRIMLL